MRHLFQEAAQQAGLPLSESKRALQMGPPLPPGATSQVERLVLELYEPRDPGDVRRMLNLYLPAGVRVEGAWIVQPGSPDEQPGSLDESVYEVEWRNAPPTGDLLAGLRQFLAASTVKHTRIREKKTQQVNARELVHDVRLLAARNQQVRLLVTIVNGPQGSLRPDEFVQVLGFQPAPGALQVERIALHQATWRRAARAKSSARWRRSV